MGWVALQEQQFMLYTGMICDYWYTIKLTRKVGDA